MMRNSSKSDEGKPKNEQVTMRDIHRVAEANQLRLQQLEVAVANLTTICTALRNDTRSSGAMSTHGSSRRVMLAEANGTKAFSSRSSSPGLDSKDEMLGFQMQQLVEQAAALGIFKESRTTSTRPIKVSALAGHMRNQRPQTKAVLKNVQPTTTQKSSTKPQESSTQKKMSTKLAAAAKNMGTTQPKGKSSPQSTLKNKRPATTAKVALRSTVKKTRTTISEVYLESATMTTKKNNETSRSNISVRSSVQNVRRIGVEGNGSVKLKIKADQGDKTQYAAKSCDQKVGNSSLSTVKSDAKPRRRWTTTKEITLKK